MNKFEISEEIEELSEDILDFNKSFRKFYTELGEEEELSRLPNPYLLRKLHSAGSALYQRASQLKKRASEFECLVLESAEECLGAQKTFLFWQENRISIDDAIARILGTGIISACEQALVAFPQRDFAHMHEIEAANLETIDIHTYNRKERAELIQRLRRMALHGPVSDEVFPADWQRQTSEESVETPILRHYLSLNIYPSSEAGGGGYSEETFEVDLDPELFRIYPGKNPKLQYINPGLALLYMFHEFRHSLDGVFSKKMPAHLRGLTANCDSHAPYMVYEGRAVLSDGSLRREGHLHGQGMRLLHRQGRGIKVEQDREGKKFANISLREEEREWALLNQQERFYFRVLLPAMLKYFYIRQKEGSSSWEDACKNLVKQIPDIKQLPRTELIEPKNLHEIFYELSYFPGYNLARQQVVRILKHYARQNGKGTKDVIRQQTPLLNGLISTGLWAWRIWPKWMCYALKNLDAYREEYFTPIVQDTKSSE